MAALLQSQVQGGLRISTSVAFGRRVLVPLVMRFMQLNPKLQIDLSFEDRYVDLVEQGIDVAFRMGPWPTPRWVRASWASTRGWWWPRPRYLAQRGAPRTPRDLARHDALIYSTVQGDARWLFTGADGRLQPTAVRGPLRSNNLSALLAAARGDMGLAALPWYVAYASVQAGRVQPVLTAGDVQQRRPRPRVDPALVDSAARRAQRSLIPRSKKPAPPIAFRGISAGPARSRCAAGTTA